ncbi:recombinase family protein [Streptomyces sp. DK15]|uniref:recombinase family protein n=1 Tax=Streptomyces sp. DK15 TaxID=2957499 RepID=UPI0029A07FA9|nr:recombinase family protein [Streptomyces sp. DK15]MDX2390176.1 recombinase family protein [Streptomyces sp. DK15]
MIETFTGAPGAPNGLAALLGGLPTERISVGYTRQSSRRANRSEASPEVQDEANEKNAHDRGSRFLRHFRDIGRSGYDPEAKRDDFDALMELARSGAFNELNVFDVSRFSRREPKDSIPVVLELFRYGITIVTDHEGVFTPDNTMELIMLILKLHQSHSESKNKSIAVTNAKRKARALGGWVGGRKPYGFDSETRFVGKVAIQWLIPLSPEAETIRLVADLIREHKDTPAPKNEFHLGSLSGICHYLNASGKYPTRAEVRGYVAKGRGGWTPGTLRRILIDPAVAGLSGDPIYKLREDGTPTQRITDYKLRRDPETGEPVQIGNPIIPPGEWYEIREWIMGRSRKRGKPQGETLLSGLGRFFCEDGRTMASRKASGTHRVESYRCTRPHGVVIEGQHSGGNNIAQHSADNFVVGSIFARLADAYSDPDTIALLMVAGKRLARATESPETRSERSALTAERADVTRAVQQLYDDLRNDVYDGPIGRERFKDEKRNLEQRAEALDARIRVVGTTEPKPVNLDQWINEGEDPMGPGSWWDKAPIEDRRLFVSLFVDRITVKKATHRGGRNLACNAEVRMTIQWATDEEAQEGAQTTV